MKKVIVTGAGGGIGSAIVSRCLEEEYHVIATDLSIESLTRFDGISEVKQMPLDITDYQEVKYFFSKFKGDSSLFALVNNAGIYTATNLLDYSEALIDQVISVNIKGAAVCSKFFIEIMRKNNNKGKIINLSSVSGQEGSSDAVYGLSKAALLGLTKSLALKFSPDILVNAVTPTMVETAMMDKIPEARKQEYYQQHLIQEPVTAKDVADTVNFLLSNESSHYTGATFDLNNGGYLR